MRISSARAGTSNRPAPWRQRSRPRARRSPPMPRSRRVRPAAPGYDSAISAAATPQIAFGEQEFFREIVAKSGGYAYSFACYLMPAPPHENGMHQTEPHACESTQVIENCVEFGRAEVTMNMNLV